MDDSLTIIWSRGSADVEWRGRVARFYGELGEGGFAASAKTMKWMFPDRDSPATKEEQEEWVNAINRHYASFKKGDRLFFPDDEK